MKRNEAAVYGPQLHREVCVSPMVRKSKVPKVEGGNVAELPERTVVYIRRSTLICLLKTYQALVTVSEAQNP